MAPPDDVERAAVLRDHLSALHDFYGEHMGVRIARKHIGWYLAGDARFDDTARKRLRATFNGLVNANDQRRFIDELFRHGPAESTPELERGMTSDGTCAA